jgi:hypothetical protein
MAGVIRHQRRIPGRPREPIGACVMDDIETEVRKTATRFGVSRSFVIAVALAEVLGVKGQESYYEPPRASLGMQKRRKR